MPSACSKVAFCPLRCLTFVFNHFSTPLEKFQHHVVGHTHSKVIQQYTVTCPHLQMILNFVLGNRNSAKLRSASVTVISLGLGQCRHAPTNVSRQRCASQTQLVAQVLPATTVLILVCPLLVAEFNTLTTAISNTLVAF